MHHLYPLKLRRNLIKYSPVLFQGFLTPTLPLFRLLRAQSSLCGVRGDTCLSLDLCLTAAHETWGGLGQQAWLTGSSSRGYWCGRACLPLISLSSRGLTLGWAPVCLFLQPQLCVFPARQVAPVVTSGGQWWPHESKLRVWSGWNVFG